MDTNADLRADSPLMTMSNSFLGDGILSLSIPGPSRDPTYYISDGNTVLLVENTLFKVHRSNLTKDKSAFEGMFQLSSENDSSKSDSSMTVAQEGENDDSPIRLQGDTADEFRALLWALYSLPHQLMVATGPDANCILLVNLARISHKYQFRSLEGWALQVLYTYFTTNPAAFDSLPASDPEPIPTHGNQSVEPRTPSLVQVTELASFCDRQDLLNLAVTRWTRHIAAGKDLALAITISERFGLKNMLGLAYFYMMLKGRAHWETEATLSREQRIRLLSGSYSLGKLWDALPGQPPVITHSARCTSQQRCTKAWGNLWKAVLESLEGMIPGLPREDVVARTMLAESMVKALVESQIPSQGYVETIPHCKESALYAATMRSRELKESLADYFTEDL
ncbi:hypothetical protein EIP91_004642 [Steccherinum ochraceum]|uniref:BTB domain-containing protein n=1 Tax=Steccherinum ochraceum TaxID=92696 RepID=A0A4R0RSI0_9APHY|nr:hypothetical protein EIP91_004642 [Steccherinum ochraceum]